MADFAWGYEATNGPDRWGEHYPAANGRSQTPVDFDPAQAQYDATLSERPLKFNYDAQACVTIANNGHSVQVTANGGTSTLCGGPLGDTYRLEQFHWHWGATSDRGSEHRVQGKMYAAELHLVHWNTAKFKSFGEAASQKGGLCVVGAFIEAGAESIGFNKIQNALSSIQYGGQATPFSGFDPLSLLPADRERYWTYEGSLTTPPCYESVTWVMLQQPAQVSEEQLKSLRGLVCDAHEECGNGGTSMVNNYRCPLPLHGRLVRASSK